MLGKILNPFSLSVLAFFPLVAWQGGLTGLTSRAASDDGKLQRRVASPSVSQPSEWGQVIPVTPTKGPQSMPPVPSGTEQLMAAAQPTLERLRSLGARYLRIEQVNGPSPYYRCRCELATGPDPATRQPFEAQGRDPQMAALGVLSQVLTQAPSDHFTYQPDQR